MTTHFVTAIRECELNIARLKVRLCTNPRLKSLLRMYIMSKHAMRMLDELDYRRQLMNRANEELNAILEEVGFGAENSPGE